MGLVWPAAAPAERGRDAPTRTLATPWPAHDACASYHSVDLSVDDRVSAVEWRGSGGEGVPVSFDLVKSPSGHGDEQYRLGSDGTDCHVGQTSCLVYRQPAGRVLHVRAVRATGLLPTDFKPGADTQLLVYGSVGRRDGGARSGRSADFGLRLTVHCADATKASVAWQCDARACVPRTFRPNVKMQEHWKNEGNKPRREQRAWPKDRGPYRTEWQGRERRKDLTRLICMRGPAGLAAIERAVRHTNPNLLCQPDERTSFADSRPLLIELGRDLLTEMDAVADEGCAGACSTRVDELRSLARGIAGASDLRVTGMRAAYHESHDEFGYGAYPSFGWVASLRAGAGAIEVVCARRRTFTSMGIPEAEECRLTVLARGRPLADYNPDWEPSIEFLDGGAVRMLDWLPSADPYNHAQDQIVVIGSALALRQP